MAEDAWRQRGLHGALSRHPRVGTALKAAAAAALAYAIVLPFGGVADDYPYYAPLGAVVALSAAVVGSVRRALQTMLALGIGASTAVAAGVLPVPEVVSLALVVAVGGLVAGWAALGSEGSWVPVSALFVLIVGGSDPGPYVLGYLGLTAVGFVVGTGVNALVPQVLLTPAGMAQDRLRDALADQLDQVAEGLSVEGDLTADEWRDRRTELDPLARDSRMLVDTAMEARRGNWRARSWRDAAEQEYDEARALVRLATLVEDLTDLLSERESSEREAQALGPALRPSAARALTAVAEVLRQQGERVDAEDALAAARTALDELATRVADERHSTGSGLWAAASLVTSLQRVVAELEQPT